MNPDSFLGSDFLLHRLRGNDLEVSDSVTIHRNVQGSATLLESQGLQQLTKNPHEISEPTTSQPRTWAFPCKDFDIAAEPPDLFWGAGRERGSRRVVVRALRITFSS